MSQRQRKIADGTRDFQDEENPLIVRLREDIIKHAGGLGIVNLGRKFRIIDDDNSKTISFSEFVKAMNETSLRLSDLEVKVIFQLFDRHHTGEISYDDFLLMLAVSSNLAHVIAYFCVVNSRNDSFNFVMLFSNYKT